MVPAWWSLLKWKVQMLVLVAVVKDCHGGGIAVTKPLLVTMEATHIPSVSPLPDVSNGTKMPNLETETPDFRIEEEPWRVHTWNMFTEEHRPYRISPFAKQLYLYKNAHRFWGNYVSIDSLGCYCNTVYRRLTLLAGCAVITSRHILTTASSTELVLQHYKTNSDLENILGAWYEMSAGSYNDSIYITPARIHYHPKFLRPRMVNISNPVPFQYDLAVWAATWKFIGGYITITYFYLCPRASPHAFQFLSPTPRAGDVALIVGWQFVKSQRKIPLPWIRYFVKTKDHTVPCPKTEWGWFHCTPGPVWGRYGVDSGAAWHRALAGRYWLYDGLLGLAAFSLKLRSPEITHYFTNVDSHDVLDFLYDAYKGYKKYEYLDSRYEDTKGYAPIRKDLGGWYMFLYQFMAQTFDFDHTQLYAPYGGYQPWY